ncbi:MAG: hypothetical protein ACK5DJ_02705 [Bacteroidota bacterium]
MAINKNHPFEDIDGIKCAVVETGVSDARKNFLKDLLEFNRYQVVVSAETPKSDSNRTDSNRTDSNRTDSNRTPAAAPVEGEAVAEVVDAAPATYKIGVTDVTFNSVNAIYGRLLRTRNGHVVTMAYWQQQETVSRDDVPYFVISDK